MRPRYPTRPPPPTERAGRPPGGSLFSWRPLTSVRTRILGWSVVLLAAGIAVSTVATRVVLDQAMTTRVNAELAHEIAEFRALEARRGTGERPESATPGSPSAAARAQLISLLRARARQAVLEQDTVLFGLIDGTIVATSSNTSPAAVGGRSVLRSAWATTQREVNGSTQLARGQARYTAVPVRLRGDPVRGVFVAAVLTGPQRSAIDRVLRWQLAAGAVALLLGLAVAWFTAGRVLRPVRDTTDLAQRITETDLSGRIPVRGRHEAAELAMTFNRMLDRLESAVTAQRQFLADAGHELRTPITIIQGNLDTITTADDVEALSIASDELTRMTRLVDELLLLASSERPDFLRVQPVDLAAMTRSLVAKARGLDSRPWVLAGTARGTALLDPQRITQAVMQLAANAVAHTPAGTPVEISSASDGATVELVVADHGPGIRAADRERVFRRFARLDPRRTSGTGLGLSIVAAISAAHGGRVSVTQSAGGGATFRMLIPLRENALPTAAATSATQAGPVPAAPPAPPDDPTPILPRKAPA